MANADDKFRSELDAFLNKTVGHVVFDDWAVVETLMRAAVGWGFTFKYDADKLKGLSTNSSERLNLLSVAAGERNRVSEISDVSDFPLQYFSAFPFEWTPWKSRTR